MPLELSKCYFPYCFYLISDKVYEDIGYYDVIYAFACVYDLRSIQPSFTIVVAL